MRIGDRVTLIAMGDNSLRELLLQLGDDVLNCLTIDKLTLFVDLTSKLKNDIILSQPPTVPVFEPPEFLPPSIRCFLGNSCGLTQTYVDDCWSVLKGVVWHRPALLEDSSEVAFGQHGLKQGLSESTVEKSKTPANIIGSLSCIVPIQSFVPEASMSTK